MGVDEKASETGSHVWSKHGCWWRLQKTHWRARANHRPYHLGNGLLIVVVVWREAREGYSTWEMSEEIEKQNCNSMPEEQNCNSMPEENVV